MKWLKEIDLSFLIPEGIANTPLGIVALILVSLLVTSVIIIYIASVLVMYKTKRIKRLGLDYAPISVLVLPAKLNIYDKFLIRNYKSKDLAARSYFETQYKLALEKRAAEDLIREAQGKRSPRKILNKSYAAQWTMPPKKI